MVPQRLSELTGLTMSRCRLCHWLSCLAPEKGPWIVYLNRWIRDVGPDPRAQSRYPGDRRNWSQKWAPRWNRRIAKSGLCIKIRQNRLWTHFRLHFWLRFRGGRVNLSFDTILRVFAKPFLWVFLDILLLCQNAIRSGAATDLTKTYRGSLHV